MRQDTMLQVRQIMCRDMPKLLVDTWFDDVEFAGIRDGECLITTGANFKRDFILSRYIPDLQKAFGQIFGRECTVTVELRPEPPYYPLVEEQFDYSDFVFENFVVGESNRFAAAAARAVAELPGKTYNPLFLYGQSGMGKTHLLYAIMNRVRKDHPEYAIRVFSAEQFTNELVTALQKRDTSEFHDKYRQADLLLVDDIQFIAGRDFSQTEFFHTFNALYEQGHQIVLTSDRPPRQFDVKTLEERLITRFEWGLTIDLKPPDFETRVAIVRSKAERIGLYVSDVVAEYVARTMTANVRQLEGTIKKLLARRDLMNDGITLESAQSVVGDLIRENPGLNPTPALIISAVCNYYGVDERQLLGKSRQAEIVSARQVAMYVIRSLTSMSLEHIGEKVFDRDHTTVMHAVKQVEARRAVDAAFDNGVKSVMENVRGS